MEAASFFTGAGGFDIGFEEAGIEIVFQCERDKFANQLLNDKYPNIKRSDDITTLHPTAIPDADIYFGGFPCQDASTAGDRKGFKGEKTKLFYQFARLIKANRPKWLVLENVVGLLHSGGRADFKSVIETLAQCGYSLSWRVLDSQYFGVPQRRRRVFIVGCLGEWTNPFEVLFEERLEAKSTGKNRESKTENASTNIECPLALDTSFLTTNNRKVSYSKVTPTLCASDRSFALLPSKGSNLRYATPFECERLMGFPEGWTANFSDTQRYKMLGNAVAVPVAKFLGERICEVNSQMQVDLEVAA